jgi:hypothetical protein
MHNTNHPRVCFSVWFARMQTNSGYVFVRGVTPVVTAEN